MEWFVILLIVLNVLSAVIVVATVGKRREPITPGLAAGMVVVYALYVWGFVNVLQELHKV